MTAPGSSQLRHRIQARSATWLLALALAIGMAISPAGADAAKSDRQEARKAALAHLESRDAEERMEGCTALAEVGRPSDLQPLQVHLEDEDERVRAVAEAAIWAIWSRSGDPEVDSLFQRGMAMMRDGQLESAIEVFTQVITRKPDFTEAWNKRATLYFLLGDDELSLKDCDEVLKRNPQHFGVLAGYGQIYLRKGDLQRALEYFERALAINPNMPGVEASIESLREILVKRSRRYI
ncbi:MAG TPA: tetratricopeptide repeat protein [Burkholderiales bacterium]|nr:tetratricopeptide repeat protein [Burkholderiales bacterium]